MEQHKIAEKAKLVESSPSNDHFPSSEACSVGAETPSTYILSSTYNSSSEESSSSINNLPADKILLNEKAEEPLCGGNGSGLRHFPNIDIDQNSRKESRMTAASVFRILSKPISKVAAIAVVLLVCGLFLADRSNKENNYRRLVDRAELDDLSNDFPQAIKSWKSAINQATDLGDGNKTLADLYFRLAKDQAALGERSIRGNEAATQELEKAIALYETVPYTLPEQMRAKDYLLQTLPNVTEDDLVTPWFETPESQHLLNIANESLVKGQIANAIEDFQKYVSKSNDPFSASQNVLLSTWKKLEKAIPAHSELAEKALPLMLEAAYVEKFVTAQPYDLDPIEELKKTCREENLLLDQTIAKTGRDPKNFQVMKALGLQLLHNKEYKAASVCYLRCLAMKQDPEIQKNIRLCYVASHPSSLIAAERRLSVLNDLRALYAEAFGETSGHVTETLSQMATIYFQTGELEQAEKLMKEVLARTRQERTQSKSTRRNIALTVWNTPEFAYDELFKFYVLTGDLGKARALNLIGKNDTALDTHYGDNLKEHFVRLCGKSNRMDDPALKEQQQH